MERKNAWAAYAQDDSKVEAFAKAYRDFIDNGKTERECVDYAVKMAKERGFEDLMAAVREGRKLSAGARVYVNWMGKCFMLFVLGEKPLDAGMNILGAHIDSPRIDVKQNPLYEDEGSRLSGYALLRRHQEVSVGCDSAGTARRHRRRRAARKCYVNIGEADSDPVFCISDLLVHLAQEQMSKDAKSVIEGEALNLIVGGRPLADEEKDAVKANVLKILKDKYDVEEEDFLSAELEIVPAGKARDMGFDRSMILGYGHDDRVCAYPSMAAVLDYEGTPEYTLCCVITDKEEIGSVGATGMGSHYFENTVAELYACTKDYCELGVRRTLMNSRMLSSDVSAGFDPNFASAFEAKKQRVPRPRHLLQQVHRQPRQVRQQRRESGIHRRACAKSWMTRVLRSRRRSWVSVDLGGGGTIAYLCAKYGMNVIDSGIAVLSMHAPYEIISKVDLYEGYRCYCAFLKGAHPVD